jgi:hypothetical protein
LGGVVTAAHAQSPAPTVEEVEAQIKAEEAKQAAAAKSAREAQSRREAEASRKAEAERQARVKREAEAAREREAAAAQAAAQQATLIIKTDTRCQLSINGEGRGWLEAASAQRTQVSPGEQLIECAGAGRRVEQTVSVDAGKQAVVQLALPAPERFERVSEGVRDNVQNLIWASSDNGSDINWGNAGAYCASKGAGWSLPTVAALQSLYDAAGKYPQSWTYDGTAYTLKPATPLILISSCCFWSNEQNGASVAWFVSLGSGLRYAHTVGFAGYGRALCGRRS